MDKIDRLLSQLPSEPPPPNLALRICQTIQARRRRYVRVRMALSGILAVSGIWLAAPSLADWLQSLTLPPTGLPILFDWWGMSQSGVEIILTNAVSGLTSLQGTFTLLETSTWPGLAALALSTLLALDYLIPRIKS